MSAVIAQLPHVFVEEDVETSRPRVSGFLLHHFVLFNLIQWPYVQWAHVLSQMAQPNHTCVQVYLKSMAYVLFRKSPTMLKIVAHV